MEQRDGMDPRHRWKARPIISWAIRTLVLLVPVAAAVGVAAVLSRTLPRPRGLAELGWWALLFASTGGTGWVVDRLARRLLPLAVLLRLTLLFPDRAPSRFAVARRVGSTRKLEERVRAAREAGVDDDPSRAAVRILELVAALNAHDRKTRGHSERVRALTDLLADALRVPQGDRDRLRWAALLHDIGKLEVSTDILNKAGKPDPHEWVSLKRHPAAGARLAGPLLPWLGEWASAIVHHHERYGGGGYPYGLSGTDISLGGRILAVTDSFETMTASRSYKKPMSVRAAREELTRCAGSQFDPDVVRTFIGVSLGRLWWQVGPVSWLAQLPFISLRTAGGVARAGATTLAKATVGLVALGASGFVTVPAHGTPRPPVVQPADGATQAGDHRETPDPRPQDPTGQEPGSDGASSEDTDGTDTPTGEASDAGSGASASGGSNGGGGGDGGGNAGGGSGQGDPGSDPVGGVVDTVDGVVQDPVGSVGGAVEDPVGTVGGVVDQAGDTVGDVVEGVTGSLPLP